MDKLQLIAIAGTAKAGDAVAATGTPVDALAAGLTGEKEWILLQQAGAAAIYRTAGAKPEGQPSETLPVPAADEIRAVCPGAVARFVQAMLDGKQQDVFEETLQLIGEQNWRLPFTLLPLALEKTPDAVQAWMKPLLGERGRWLASFNSEWDWARQVGSSAALLPGNAEKIWEEGSLAERKSILAMARSLAPAQGRSWVEKVLAKEKAEQRAAFVSLFVTGLSMEDEPFLEGVLDDRSSAVREEASALLCCLPESRLSARMIDRASSILTASSAQPGKLARKVKALLEGEEFAVTAEPPQEIDKAWERDGIPAKPPHGTGKRAFWLEELVCRIPPAHWEARWGKTREEILRAFQKSEWKEALVDGLHRAVLRFRDVAWAVVLFDLELTKAKRGSSPWDSRELARLVPAPILEEKLGAALANIDTASEACAAALEALPRPWSLELSRHYLQAMRTVEARIVKEQKVPDSWLSTMAVAALKLSPLVIPEALVPWFHPENGQQVPYTLYEWVRVIDQFVETVQFRQDLIKEIQTWQK